MTPSSPLDRREDILLSLGIPELPPTQAAFDRVRALGPIVDIAVASMSATRLGLPLWIVATPDFIAAAVLIYATRVPWTFQECAQARKTGRAFQHALSLLLMLGTRLAGIGDSR